MDNLFLRQKANEMRKWILTGTYRAKSGHPGGSLSAADILAYLYFEEMKVDPSNPKDPGRDRFVLSKGHGSPALYAALGLKGFFPIEEIEHLRHIGSHLQGHPDMRHTPGVDMSTGSLGQGVSAAIGMALAGKLDQAKYRVYALAGDGEMQEGQIWEAAMFAGNHGLDNMVWIVDNNGLQIDGPIEDINSPYPLDKKFEAFHFHVIPIEDGHDFDQLRDAYAKARQIKGRPSVIIARTIKGKGVSFMENQVNWHGVAPNEEQYHAALQEVEEEARILWQK